MNKLIKPLLTSLSIILLFGCNKNPEQEMLNEKLSFLSKKVHEIEKQSENFEYMIFYYNRDEATAEEVVFSAKETQNKMAELIEEIRKENAIKTNQFEIIELQNEFHEATQHLIDGYNQRIEYISIASEAYSGEFSYPNPSIYKSKLDYANGSYIYNISQAQSGYMKVKEWVGMDTSIDEFDGLLNKQ